jgi:hypothetical protein
MVENVGQLVSTKQFGGTPSSLRIDGDENNAAGRPPPEGL